MRNILLLISMLGLLPAGCGRTVSDTDTVSCDTFVYSVKGGGSLRLDGESGGAGIVPPHSALI